MKYDLIVIGSGPGGYVAAIRASQQGKKTALVERAEVGGICLNWGCIPTKALLKSAEVFTECKHAQSYGINLTDEAAVDFPAVIGRSRDVAAAMSRGVQFLLKKNNIDILQGFGKVKPGKIVEVASEDGKIAQYEADYIILAVGARSRELPDIKQDGVHIIGYREALTLEKQPETMLVIGSGAIGSELAYFYNAIGTQVTLAEYMPRILPAEDEDSSKQIERSMKKAGMKIMTEASVEKVEIVDGTCKVSINTKRKGVVELEVDVVLSAVGVVTNIENIGLEEVGIKTEKGKIIVDDFYATDIPGYYAIGDIVHGPALAHTASHEALICIDKIGGKDVHPMDYGNIPSCTYITPEVASVGLTEAKALEEGYEIKVGKFPFTASGKATAAGAKDGFIKVIFDAKTNLLLGVHMVGAHVTEMIAEAVALRQKKATAQDILAAVHPHPTMSEAFMEATSHAMDECVHL
ncbi:MAG: dihydrolipoyl dehydrogenase [Bacteroidales bacterium]|jgi:dihydrolipoamide dehydrogenase|nr:dihydrolipoyl dehydrogenase [Bacteroidales bacterium]